MLAGYFVSILGVVPSCAGVWPRAIVRQATVVWSVPAKHRWCAAAGGCFRWTHTGKRDDRSYGSDSLQAPFLRDELAWIVCLRISHEPNRPRQVSDRRNTAPLLAPRCCRFNHGLGMRRPRLRLRTGNDEPDRGAARAYGVESDEFGYRRQIRCAADSSRDKAPSDAHCDRGRLCGATASQRRPRKASRVSALSERASFLGGLVNAGDDSLAARRR